MNFSARSLVIVTFTGGLILLAGCDNPQQKEAKHIQRGNAYFEQGDYEKAYIEYKNAGRINPTDAEVAYRLGLVDDVREDYRAAFADFTYAEQQNAHHHPALLKLAQYFLAAENYDEAQARVDAVLADTPDDAEGRAMLAALFLRKNDFAATEREARAALAKEPSNITAFSVLTGLYNAQGDTAKAAQTIEDGVARNPKSLPLQLLRAQLYERDGNFPKLAEAYQAIFGLKPTDASYRADLATIYVNAQKLDEAEATLRDGVKTVPDSWEMKDQLIVFLDKYRGLDAAEKEIRAYMQTYPDRSELYFTLADLYSSHGAADRAEALLQQLVAKDESNDSSLTARATLARLHFAKGDASMALKLAKTVLEKDSTNEEALYVRAALSVDRGAYEDAVSDLRAIIRDHPQSQSALRLLSETFLLQGHINLAIDTLNQLIEIEPFDSPGRVRLAQMHHLNGDSKTALTLLAVVTKSDPTYPVAWENTARIAIDLKDEAAAADAIHALDALPNQHMTAVFLDGQLLAKDGKEEDAVANFKQVIDADPSTPLAEHALSALVDSYHHLNQMDAAAHYIESLPNKSSYALTALGECYVALGNFELGTATLEQAIASQPTDQAPWLGRADLYIKDGQIDSALGVLDQAMAALPADPRAAMKKAELLGSTGKWQEAVAVYEELLRRNPHLDAAANNLAELVADYAYTDMGAVEKARHLAEQFAGTKNPFLLDTLGWIYYRSGDIQQALAVMKRAHEAGVSLPPQSHYHYGAILMATGKPVMAKAELQQATQDDPAAYPGLDDAKKLLSGL